MWILYAPNIYRGGGRTLLLSLIQHLKTNDDLCFILDSRLDVPDSDMPIGNVYRVKPKYFSRIYLEIYLLFIKKKKNILCFGNLPPLLANFRNCYVFLQNRYLVDMAPLSGFPLNIRIKLGIERLWFLFREKSVSQFIVQTKSMHNKLHDHAGRNSLIMPLFPKVNIKKKNSFTNDKTYLYDFIYVASGEEHKNHRRLVNAWILLSNKGKKPSLCLTVNAGAHTQLVRWIEDKIKQYNLNITLCGELDREEVQKLYTYSCALIYPSLFESFGLPLFEAVSVGLPIIASNLDYVHDIIRPSAVFDPFSPSSIAEAVSQFQFEQAKAVISPLDSKEFLERVINLK